MKTVVVFLTDGRDSCNTEKRLKPLASNVHTSIKKLDENVIFHTVGFSKDHAFEFLKNVADTAGTAPGMFRYCEPGDDKTVLLQKLQELFDFITNSDKTCNIHVELLNECSTFVSHSNTPRIAIIKGKLKTDEETKEMQITGEVWISMSIPSAIPEVKVSVGLDDKNASLIPCKVRRIERNELTTADEKSLWRLNILDRNMDSLMTKAINAVSTKSDVSQLQTRVEKYQKLISKTKVFGNGITKDRREQLLCAVKDIQKRLDEVHSMLAEYLRTGTDSLSLLARAHDMRYQAVFKKNRLQRVMDQRVSKNMQQASLAQQQLANLVVDTAEVDALSKDANGFYYCILSQNSVSDILLGDEKEDAVGFGLAVKRSEVVLDEPTLVRIHVISGTLVSRSAMLDALEYKINISSHLKAHGGFTFNDGELGVTTIGTSREPINSWLPLYITQSHWERIKVLLKPCLGSFCTLDPLGYHYKQLDVLFSVLGAMVGQLSDDNVGQHQLQLLFAVMRTCTACLIDFDLTTQVQECLTNFLASPAGRTKDIIPNLYTVIGYAVSLPLNMREEIFNKKDSVQTFLLALISEWLRRCAGSLYREASVAKLHGILKALIGNDKTDQTTYGADEAEDRLVQLCQEVNLDEFQITPYDPAADIIEPDIEVTHSEHVDKAMELWAEKKTGVSENIDKTQRKAYQKAMKEITKWLNVGQEVAGNDADDKEDAIVNTATDKSAIDSATGGIETNKELKMTDSASDRMTVSESELQAMSNVICQLTKSSYPHVTSLPGITVFVIKWMTCQQDSTCLDGNSGIVPDDIVQEIKTAVKQLYKDLKGSTADGAAGDSFVTERPETTVTSGDQAGAKEHVNNDNVDNGDDTNGSCQSKCSVETESGTDSERFYEYGIDYDYNDDDDDDVDDDDGEEDDEETGQRYIKHKSKQQDINKQMCLPKLLKIIYTDCDVVLCLRAMLCQAVRFHSNSKARTAIACKEMLDTTDSTTLQTVMESSFKHLDDLKVTAKQNTLNQAIWRRANHCMLHATTPLAFIGYLMNTYTSRNEGFPDLIELFMTTVGMENKPPCLKEKVHILLTGKYLDHPVLDNGNQWLPEKKMAINFQKLLGEEVWGTFEAELRSTVQIHVYRASDIPNRHGHCNSNPYIPNVLRSKLGMKLLPEPSNKQRIGRRRRNIKH